MLKEDHRLNSLGIDYSNFQTPDFFRNFSYRIKKGMGVTIGNSLRRTILAHILGYAIRSVNIEGISHEFSYISGVKESIQTLIMNLRKVIFKGEIDKSKAFLNINGKNGEIFSSDIKCAGGLQVVNKHLFLCTVDEKVDLKLDMDIEKGTGHILAKSVYANDYESSAIICDAFFSPIINVNFEVISIENNIYEEELILSITTNGSVTPEEALDQAIIIWRDEIAKISNKIIEPAQVNVNQIISEKNKIHSVYLAKKIKKLDLPSRVLSCLESLNIKYIGELVQMTEEKLLSEPKFGQGSLDHLNQILNNMNLKLGMDLGMWRAPEFDEDDTLIR